MARVGGGLFLAGAALVLASLVLPHPSGADMAAFVAIDVAALAVGVVLLTVGPRLPLVAFQGSIALGVMLISMLLYLRRDFSAAYTVPVEMSYVWAVLYSGYFFSRRMTMLLVLLALAGYGIVQTAANTEVAVVSWLVTAMILLVSAWVVTALRDRSEREVAARRKAADELSSSLSLLQATLESTADGILVVDREGRMVSFNSKFVEMWKIPPELSDKRDDPSAIDYVIDQLADPEQFSAKIEELYSKPDSESFDVLEFKDGRVFERYSQPQWIEGEPVGRVWSFRDVTDRRRFVERLQRLADHDPLTRLYNRRRFEEEFSREVEYVRRYDAGGALLILDLDNFKFVNDAQGHACGDQMLREVAAIMTSSLRGTDIVGRLGGDEFAAVVRRVDADHARHAAEDLADAIREHRFAFRGQRLRTTASIGVVPIGPSEGTADDLMIDADLAMYSAKEAGRDHVVMHAPGSEDHVEARKSLDWSRRIREALDEDRFVLFAQPILDLVRDEVTQYELLLRMRGSDGAIVPPGAFLGMAERLGLILEIDRWTTRSAIRLLEQLRKQGSSVQLEINLSGRSMGDPGLPAVIGEELDRSEVDPSNLIFELTETAAISNMDSALSFAETLTRLGCRFALDDFGAGFGSFYYLKHLPVDYVKIDGDFIRNLPRNPTDQIVVSSMVDIANAMKVKTIAEFVRDAETVRALRGFGVDYAQGAEIGMPIPIETAFAPAAESSNGSAQAARPARSRPNSG